jgi:hypothetical protein
VSQIRKQHAVAVDILRSLGLDTILLKPRRCGRNPLTPFHARHNGRFPRQPFCTESRPAEHHGPPSQKSGWSARPLPTPLKLFPKSRRVNRTASSCSRAYAIEICDNPLCDQDYALLQAVSFCVHDKLLILAHLLQEETSNSPRPSFATF